MKKLVSCVLMLILVMAAAYAESDFSSLSDSELMKLYDEIRAEMTARGLIGNQERTLRDGKYIIGKDIPAGMYRITCTQTEWDNLSDAYNSLDGVAGVFDDSVDFGSIANAFSAFSSLYGMRVEILGDYGDVVKESTLNTGDSISILLEEGTALKISEGVCTLTPAD